MMSVSTKDVDIYESRTGLKVAEVVETQEKRLIKDTTRKCVRPGGKARVSYFLPPSFFREEEKS